MSQIVAQTNPSVLAMVLAVLMLAAWRFGAWIAQFRRVGATTTSKFDDASMALLALLLAFTFGTSMTKHDQRRIAVLADSNAIGDFYTCATLLKEPTRSRLQKIVRGYAELRLSLARQDIDSPTLDTALVQFQRMHDQMTELVRQALNDGTPIAVSLTNTLNAVTSNQAARLAAVRDRLPISIVMLLFVSAIAATMLSASEQEFVESSAIAGTVCFILIVGLAVFVILDLNRPELGLIRVSQEPIERLLSSMTR